MNYVKLLSLLCFILSLYSCKQSEENLIPASHHGMKNTPRVVNENFRDYWFSGVAEITTYELQQVRYGEKHQGTAATIFVSEDFLPEAQVKANSADETTVTVLKLNQVKKFSTGIYPYSVMTSTFSPIEQRQHALKTTHSMQEWCGQIYMQLNNRKKFDVILHSYFEGEADASFTLEKTWLENEVWNVIRVNPEELPTGDFTMIPSFESARMYHQPLAVENVSGSLTQGDSLSTYRLNYPKLKRELIIYFESAFPYSIERWEEIHPNGLKTKAVKMERIKTDYWRKNTNEFEFLRDTLQLK